MSTPTKQLAALGQAEATLFLRAKSNIVNVLFIPALVLVALTVTMSLYDLESLGLAMGSVMPATATGIVLVFSLYVPLTGTYVARREELLLKRLRTGEVNDFTILLGAVMVAGFAAATSAAAQSSENVQVATLPLLVLFPSTSGAFFPLEAMPQPVQDAFYWMPMTPVIDLVRLGWDGAAEPGEAFMRIALLGVWTIIALGAAHRWFRWEPRV